MQYAQVVEEKKMSEPKKQPVIKKSQVQISSSINSAISCARVIQEADARCPGCGQRARKIEAKEFERQDKTGLSLKFLGSCLHTWRIMLFPIGGGAFKGEFKFKDQTYNVITSKATAKEVA